MHTVADCILCVDVRAYIAIYAHDCVHTIFSQHSVWLMNTTAAWVSASLLKLKGIVHTWWEMSGLLPYSL